MDTSHTFRWAAFTSVWVSDEVFAIVLVSALVLQWFWSSMGSSIELSSVIQIRRAFFSPETVTFGLKKKIISYYLFYKNKFQKATLNLYFFIKSSNRVIITVIKNRLNQLIFWEKNASATWGLIKADIKATNCCKMVHHY